MTVWGCMAASGVDNLVFINGIMDKIKYKSFLENLQASAVTLGTQDNYYFQYDNDRSILLRYSSRVNTLLRFSFFMYTSSECGYKSYRKFADRNR